MILKTTLTIVFIFCLIFLNGCGISRFTYYRNLTNFTKKDLHSKAINFTEKHSKKFYGRKNTLLYYLDRGYLLHIAGNYSRSNIMFTKAKNLIEAQFTRSISKEVFSLLTNEKAKPFYSQDFEKSLIYFFNSLNYLLSDELEDSLVEIRALNHFLTVLQTNYGNKKVYKEDAFLRYIAGLIYESGEERNNAFISYRKALYTYKNNFKYFNTKIPQDLFNSTINTAYSMGFYDEIEKIKKDFPRLFKNYTSQTENDYGELIVLHYTGLIPHIISTNIEMAFSKAWLHVGTASHTDKEQEDIDKARKLVHSIASKEQLVIAFPKYEKTKYNITTSEININNKIYKTEIVQDLGNIAIKTLEDHKAKTNTKTIARAAIKYALSKNLQHKVDEKANNTFGFLLKSAIKATSALTEVADTRSWQILPDKIRMKRIKLSPGTHSLICNYYDKKKHLLKQESIENIKIEPNKSKLLILYTQD